MYYPSFKADGLPASQTGAYSDISRPICFLMPCYEPPQTFGQNVFRKQYDRDRGALRIWDMSTLERNDRLFLGSDSRTL